MTTQQRLVLNVVTELHNHPDAAEVYISAKQRMPQIGTATVYRNLALLTKQGLLRRIPVSGEADRYDATMTPHEHVLCRECGRVRDIDISSEIGMIKRKAGGEELDVEIILRETCEACRALVSENGTV